jgi:hypothetical protein
VATTTTTATETDTSPSELAVSARANSSAQYEVTGVALCNAVHSGARSFLQDFVRWE